MDKKKKIILISVIAVVIILITIGVIWYLVANNKSESSNSPIGASGINELYETLQAKDVFSFELTTLDGNNKMYYAKSGNSAYTDTIYNGTESKYVIKDGNSYLLKADTKTYYTYNNNSANLNKVVAQLETLKDLEYQKGEEKVDGKNYNYVEYSGATNFAMEDFSKDSEDVKTRFYFDGDKLVYIKTLEGEKQELLKVEISYDVDQSLFQIPSNYRGT